MPTSEMSEERLSLLIAEFLEPSPTWKDWWEGESAWQFYIRSTECVSDGGCWEVYRADNEADDDNDEALKHPRNMVTDPAMTVMLMEKLGEMWTTITLSKRGVRISVRTKRIPLGHQGARYIIKWVKGETLGRAVCEVFAQANGLGEGRWLSRCSC